MEGMDMSKAKAAKISESDFKPVSGSYGNELRVSAKDFPGLAKGKRGDNVIFMVRGSMKEKEKAHNTDGPQPVGGGKDDSLSFYLWDCAIMSDHSGKEKEKGEGIKNYFKAKE